MRQGLVLSYSEPRWEVFSSSANSSSNRSRGWPIELALPEVEAELAAEGREHIRDRCDVVTIGRMRNTDEEHANLIDGISKLCKEANLELSLRADDLPMQRLTHASDDSCGIAITPAKLAVLHAVRNGSSRLEIQHFRDVYASSANFPVADGNPFVSDNWEQIDTSGIGEKVGLIDTLKSMNGPKKVVLMHGRLDEVRLQRGEPATSFLPGWPLTTN
ncbi:hypothetical protein N8D56_18840 [Devosia sp. A8/3-2]|nr:hypothetical protein N8D56_18840 [Devosia sp. A8/3-2]